MLSSFRLSMTWLHTWFGLVLGYVLIVCFFFGTLSVFDREIDRWAIPETRYAPQPMPSFDRMLLPIFRGIEPDEESYDRAQTEVEGPLPPRGKLVASDFGAYTTHRDPVLGMYVAFDVPNKPKSAFVDHVHVYGTATIDPRTGAKISDDKLEIGSGFFYPLHYSLHLLWRNLGYWIVGLAALTMLAALVTGMIMHRTIFREFFTFRPHKQTQRSVLDLHNLTGVVALPFHFFFAFSGLVIFASSYLPVSGSMFKAQHDAHEQLKAQQTGLPHDPAGVPAPTASVDAMVEEARRRWAARGMSGEVGFLEVTHAGDANGYVSVYRAGTDRVTQTGRGIHFRAKNGEVIREAPQRPPSTASTTGLRACICSTSATGCYAGSTCSAASPAASASPPAWCSSSRSASASTPGPAAAASAGSTRWRRPRSPARSSRPPRSSSPTVCCPRTCRGAATGRSACSGSRGSQRCCTRPGAARLSRRHDSRRPGASSAGRSPRCASPRRC